MTDASRKRLDTLGLSGAVLHVGAEGVQFEEPIFGIDAEPIGDRFADPAALVRFIEAQKGLAKVRDNKLVVRRDWPKASDRVKGAFSIARDLAKMLR